MSSLANAASASSVAAVERRLGAGGIIAIGAVFRMTASITGRGVMIGRPGFDQIDEGKPPLAQLSNYVDLFAVDVQLLPREVRAQSKS